MRIQQRCILGKGMPMRLKAIREAERYVVCAQLCCEARANMKASMEDIVRNK